MYENRNPFEINLMKRLTLVLLLLPFGICAQQRQLDSLLDQVNTYLYDTTRIDSLILTCEKIREIDRRKARKSTIYYHLTFAYFEVGDSKKALKNARKAIPMITLVGVSRTLNKRNIQSRAVCYRRYQYYYQQGEYRKAYKNLYLMFRKYVMEFCGVGREAREKLLRQQMIECLEKSGKEKKAKRLQQKWDNRAEKALNE